MKTILASREITIPENGTWKILCFQNFYLQIFCLQTSLILMCSLLLFYLLHRYSKPCLSSNGLFQRRFTFPLRRKFVLSGVGGGGASAVRRSCRSRSSVGAPAVLTEQEQKFVCRSYVFPAPAKWQENNMKWDKCETIVSYCKLPIAVNEFIIDSNCHSPQEQRWKAVIRSQLTNVIMLSWSHLT
jgi:hypothetical protein